MYMSCLIALYVSLGRLVLEGWVVAGSSRGGGVCMCACMRHFHMQYANSMHADCMCMGICALVALPKPLLLVGRLATGMTSHVDFRVDSDEIVF